MNYRLSSTEREFAEDHHSLVYSFLNKNKLDENEYYDIAVLGYLRAVRRYFIEKNLGEYNFSTIAWRAMQSAVGNEKRKKSLVFRSLDEFAFEDGEVRLIDTFGNEDNMDEKIVYMELLNTVQPHITDKQKDALLLKADGFSYKDMAEKFGITRSGVGSRLDRMRKKVRVVLIEE